MSRFKVGAQFHPQHCSMDDLRAGWREADAMGVDSVWTWDHFYPLYGEPDGPHFEGWSMLAAMACDTKHGHVRRHGHLQLVPQPRAPGRHGA